MQSLKNKVLPSLSCNGFVRLSNSDVAAHVTEGTTLVSEFLCSMNSFSHRQWSRIVVHLELILSSDSVVNSTNAWVLVIQPWSLHISLLLWVVILWVDFADKVWDFLNALLVISSHLTTSKNLWGLIKVSNRFLWSLWTICSKVIPVFSAPVPCIMVVWMANDNGSESCLCTCDGSVNERKLCNVVLVDHTKNGFHFLLVYLWGLDFLHVCGCKFSIAIIWNQSKCLLFWLSVDWTKRCWNSTWWETVQVSFFGTFLFLC